MNIELTLSTLKCLVIRNVQLRIEMSMLIASSGKMVTK